MPDPTGRWINHAEWQCPACGTVNAEDRERCQGCGESVRPSTEEPIRPPDPADIIGRSKRTAGEAADQ
jgi:ferredoxin